MNNQVQEYGQEAQEKLCAGRFLKWLSARKGVDYRFQRAEEVFPDLKDQLRWEFVAWQKGSAEWVGIEVKRLPFLGLNRPWSDWRKLCSQVNEKVQGRLNGTILIRLPPVLNLSQQRRKELVSVLAEVIIQKAAELETTSEFSDIGPQIAARFLHWPESKSNLKEYRRWGEYRPSSIKITKESNQGCQVRLSGVGIGGDFIEAHRLALAQVFDPQKGAKANEQLRLAKAKGAKSTILLLDCDPGYQGKHIWEYLRGFSSAFLSNIQYVYLVGDKNVVRVYPT